MYRKIRVLCTNTERMKLYLNIRRGLKRITHINDITHENINY